MNAEANAANAAEVVTVATAKLYDAGLSHLTAEVAKLNRRAAKLKLEPLTIASTVEVTEYVDKVTGILHRHNLHTVTVSGRSPRVDGWQVVALIEFTPAGNLISGGAGSGDVRPEWRTVENRCDHCNTKRRRTDLVVIRHDDGNEKIVGRNCLADYLRTTDAEQLLKSADIRGGLEKLASDSEAMGFSYGANQDGTSLETILQAASLCVRKLGWRPASAGNDCTRADVVRLLNQPPSYSDAYRSWVYWVDKHDLHLTEHDAAEAVKAREFLATIPTNAASDYLHNLRVIRDLDFVPSRQFGLAVSVISAAQKARDAEVKRKEAAAGRGPLEFIGAIGERLRALPVEVKRVRSFDGGEFGVKTIVTFKHATGELTWFAAGDQTECWPEGESFTIDATVKEHKSDEKFGNSTIVNRVAIHETKADKAAAKAAAKAKAEADAAEAAEWAAKRAAEREAMAAQWAAAEAARAAKVATPAA